MERRFRWPVWLDWRLVVILILALVMRLPYLDTIGHNDLTRYNPFWIEAIQQYGMFDIYEQNATFNYPPLYLPMLGLVGQTCTSPDITPTFVILHKVYPIVAELLLVVAVYAWLPRGKASQWLIPGLLAVYPGLIVTSAFWGQIDSIFTLFLVLALIALNCDRPIAAWVWFTFGALTKFPALVIAPLLLVLTFRRYGAKRTLIAIGVSAGIMIVVLLPFVIGSGLVNALRPFTSAVDVDPTTTGYAFNLWYGLIPSVWSARPPLVYELVPNNNLLLGLISYRQVGILMFGLFALLILVSAWKRGGERREFIWAGALYFGFFMLPTQVHERYLYPAAVLLLVGAAQDRRLWPVALGTMFTYSYNVIVPTQAPFSWLGLNWLFTFGDITLHVALLNLILLAWTTWVAVSVPKEAETTPSYARINRWIGLVSAGAAGVLVLSILLHAALPDSLPPNAIRLTDRLDDKISLEGYEMEQDGDTWTVNLYWNAQEFTNEDYAIFLHLVQNGETIAQQDERPQNGAYPTWRWYGNRLVKTPFTLTLPPGSHPDTIYAGLYNPQTMMNLPVVQNGQETPDGRVLVWRQG